MGEINIMENVTIISKELNPQTGTIKVCEVAQNPTCEEFGQYVENRSVNPNIEYFTVFTDEWKIHGKYMKIMLEVGLELGLVAI
jgi:hypothetical protein